MPLSDKIQMPNNEIMIGKIVFIAGARNNHSIKVFRKYWNYGRTGMVWTDSALLRQIREDMAAAKPVIENMHAVILSAAGELEAKGGLENLHRYKGNPLWENYRSGSKPSVAFLGRDYQIEGRPERADQLVLTSPDTRQQFLVASFAVRTR
ncbi:MAG: hypothetical protein AAF692_11900 [Pseudomonadota bacterium]